MPTSTSVKQNATAKPNLNTVFGLDKKMSGTKIYYSEKLGVGFTYVPHAPGTSYAVTITEISNKIYVHKTDEAPDTGQSIEVFAKDPKLTLEEAMKARFLTGYNPSDCLPKSFKTSLPNYAAAGIAYAQSDDLNNPTKNSGKCPANYTDLSDFEFIQYFLMNKDVQGSFMFVRIGISPVTPDGTAGIG